MFKCTNTDNKLNLQTEQNALKQARLNCAFKALAVKFTIRTLLLCYRLYFFYFSSPTFSFNLSSVLFHPPGPHHHKASTVSTYYIHLISSSSLFTVKQIFSCLRAIIFSIEQREGISVWQRPEFHVIECRKRRLPLGGLSHLCCSSWTWFDFFHVQKMLKSDCYRSISVAKCLHKHHLCGVGGTRQEVELLHLYFSHFSTQGGDDWNI